jgi:hypothetical protein
VVPYLAPREPNHGEARDGEALVALAVVLGCVARDMDVAAVGFDDEPLLTPLHATVDALQPAHRCPSRHGAPA